LSFQRYIIMAAGAGSRWGQAGLTSKHELVVDGETLLGHTCRLLVANGVEDIVISGPYPHYYPLYGATNFLPSVETDIVDGRLAVRELWNTEGRTVILMGDVYYTESAIRTIVRHGGTEPHMFARFGKSRVTGKPNAEIWANSFMPEHHVAHEASLRQAHALMVPRFGSSGEPILRAGMWESYLLDHGMLIDRPSPWWIADLGDATVIDDWTEDFDYPEDYLKFIERRKA